MICDDKKCTSIKTCDKIAPINFNFTFDDIHGNEFTVQLDN
jgi:hypothetical protein